MHCNVVMDGPLMGAEEQRAMIEDRAPRRGQDQVAIHACLQQD
jgi:hypothetical protein